MYADTLDFIYSQGLVHGDAHLGNVLIFDDPDRRFRGLTPHGASFALKVADMGTSAFWRVHAEFGAREADIIVETLSRLFPDRELRLNRLKRGFSHQDSLALMDRVAEYLRYMQGGGQPDRRSVYATEIVDMILDTPLFDLDQVMIDTRRSGLTTVDRVARRLNARLLGLSNALEADPGLTDTTRRLYHEVGERFVDRLATGAPLPPRTAP
jgi:phage tail protein X